MLSGYEYTLRCALAATCSAVVACSSALAQTQTASQGQEQRAGARVGPSRHFLQGGSEGRGGWAKKATLAPYEGASGPKRAHLGPPSPRPQHLPYGEAAARRRVLVASHLPPWFPPCAAGHVEAGEAVGARRRHLAARGQGGQGRDAELATRV